MTKGLIDMLNLPSMEDVLAETEIDDVVETAVEPIKNEERGSELITHAEMCATEHARSMDKLHDEVLVHAREMTELALNLDPARSPRMFEVAGSFYKTALDAKNSKRDAQLKLMKIIQDQRKLDMDEMKMKHEMGNGPVDRADVIMVEDRNQLLKRLRDEVKNPK